MKGIDGISTFRKIAELFPVACATDEYYFFPHIKNNDCNWGTWDHFSRDAVKEAVGILSSFESGLTGYSTGETDCETETDVNLLRTFSLSLREQLMECPVWKTQPSFYLTLICKGLEEALLSPDSQAIQERINTLPAFIELATANLEIIPEIYRDIGLEMISSVAGYFKWLSAEFPGIGKSIPPLELLQEKLKQIVTTDHLYPFPEMLERQIQVHLGIPYDLSEIDEILEREIHEMNAMIRKESVKISGNENWQDAYKNLSRPGYNKQGKLGLFREEAEKLRIHCLVEGILFPELIQNEKLQVLPMPDNISAIRAASSYSISPTEPFSGTFYIYSDPGGNHHENITEYRMIAAHETYPGHHLLDSARLILARPARKAVEHPFFYEGWACFAEELLMLTGYLTQREDRFLLSLRRLRRAIRGKVDISLQTGKMNPAEAAYYMNHSGLPGRGFLSSVHKYTLNPGYQLCYTVGLRRMLELYEKYATGNPKQFSRTVLLQGEILMSDLEKVLKQSAT